MAGHFTSQNVASQHVLLDLLKKASLGLDELFIVLDGLDECERPDNTVKDILEAIKHSTAKLLIFSRPNVAFMRENFGAGRSISVTRDLTRRDLENFFAPRIAQLKSDRILPTTPPDWDLVAQLLHGADGMFLWARLMMSFLTSPALRPSMRLRVIENLTHPEGLDDMYLRILGLIAAGPQPERNLARRIFLWLVYARKHLSARQLRDILTQVEGDTKVPILPRTQGDNLDEFADFDHTVIMVCSGLTEICTSNDAQEPFYRLIHGSATDFFQCYLQRSRIPPHVAPATPTELLSSQDEAAAELGSECLIYLIYAVPAGPLSGDLSRGAVCKDVEGAFPFLSYATSLWSHHLHASISLLFQTGRLETHSPLSKFSILVDWISRFLSTRLVLMAWVESLYTFNKIDEDHQTIQSNLLSWATSIISSDKPSTDTKLRDLANAMAKFAEDIAIMHRLWGETLLFEPEQIWNDITAFTPSEFFVQTRATSVKSLVPTQFEPISLAETSLCTISTERWDGDELGVLSIWPSK
jgi:hypothetical protein